MDEIYFRDIESLPVFDSNSGVGEVYEDDGKILYAIGENPRKVELNISSWRIISNGIHYYGLLEFNNLYFDEDKNSTCGRYSFGGACKTPKSTHGIDIILRREITPQDLMKHPDRFENKHSGQLTDKFNTKKKLLNSLKKYLKKNLLVIGN